MLSLVTRMLSTPVAVSTTVTVPLATFSPSMEAVMVALPRLSAVRVAVTMGKPQKNSTSITTNGTRAQPLTF